MAELLLDVAWGCLSHPSYHNPQFDIIFPSEDVFVSTFNAAGFLFCSGLLDTIQTGAPSLAWLASVGFKIHQDQDRVPHKSWRLYLLCLPPVGLSTSHLHWFCDSVGLWYSSSFQRLSSYACCLSTNTRCYSGWLCSGA